MDTEPAKGSHIPCPREGSEDPRTVLVSLVLKDALSHGAETTNPQVLVGREALLARLTKLLLETRRGRASYLLAGYRGVGKTNVAYRAIEGYRDALKGRRRQVVSVKRLRSYVRLNMRSRLAGKGVGARIALGIWQILARLGRVVPTVPEKSGLWSGTRRGAARVRNALLFYFRPTIISLHVNLSKDCLSARDVMFEITTMLRTQVRALVRCYGRRGRWFLAAALVIVLGTVWHGAGLGALLDAALRGELATPFFNQLASRVLDFSATAWPDYRLELLAAAAAASIWLALAWWFGRVTQLCRRLEDLNTRILSTIEQGQSVTIRGFRLSRKISVEPIDEHKIEVALIDLLQRNSGYRWRKSLDPIFVLDELDKLGTHSGIEQDPETEDRLDAVEVILSNLKNLLTVGKARFLVIAGRDMLDRYQADRRATSSLYETLFDQYFEVPSLLTDSLVSDAGGFATMTETYVCRRIMSECDAIAHWIELETTSEKLPADNLSDKQRLERLFNRMLKGDHLKALMEKGGRNGDKRLAYLPYRLEALRSYLLSEMDKQIENGIENGMSAEADAKEREVEVDNVMLLLRHFIHYLTFYSAGNCKKLESLFDSFVRPVRGRPKQTRDLRVGRHMHEDQLYLRFSRRHQRRLNLGSMLYVMFYHHLHGQLRVGGDKLAVSSLVAFHNLLKFHAVPFSRHQLESMLRGEDIHRAPELGHTIDTLIALSLRGTLLKLGGGLYQFRFGYAFEQELKYISRTSDLEAATCNFSLSVMEAARLQLHRALKGAYELFGEVGVSDARKGAAEIAELNIALGEVHVLGQGYEHAERYFSTAYGTLQRASEKWPGPASALLLIEALLKLGFVQERRDRLDRAAASYELANRLVGEWAGRWREDEFVRYFAARPTRRDLLAQPYLALRYLCLKRSPTSDGKNGRAPSPLPRFRGNTALFLYQQGELEFFLGNHEQTRAKLARAITAAGIGLDSADEDSVSVGTAACVSLADSLFVEHCHDVARRMPGRRGRKRFRVADQADYVLERQLEFLEFPGRRVFSDSDDPAWLRRYLRGVRRDFNSADGRPVFKIAHMLALCALAGSLLMRRGKYYRAGMAYLRGATLWCMCFDLLSCDLMKQADRNELKAQWLAWRPVVAFLLKRAERNLSDADDRAAVRFKETFVWRDLGKNRQSGEEVKADVVSLRKTLMGADDLTKIQWRHISWHDTPVGQQLSWTMVWGDLVGESLAPGSSGSIRYFEELWQRQVPLFSTRALTFSHWLVGRRRLAHLEDMLAGDPAGEDVCACGARAAQNFYHATQHLKILAGNDQALMFPPQAFVFFHLWKTLKLIVEWVLNNSEKDLRYIDAVVRVRQDLLMNYLRRDTPGSHLDLRYVKDRALRYLRAAQNMGDVSGRVRGEIIRKKFFLAGDYQDPQFHLEWTLIQAMKPTAILLQDHIKSETARLQGNKRQDYSDESLWNYPA